MAASIWIAIRWLAAWTYCVTSTRDTTPLVTLVLSPPGGWMQRGDEAGSNMFRV
jgi:hypothetical protein